MIICLDIGNTHIYGGIFLKEQLILRFRYPSTSPCTSDTFGIFLLDFLEKSGLKQPKIEAIVLCSVVPNLEYSVIAACKKYFHLTPLELKPGIKTGIKLDIKNPLELGADRIANAIAGTYYHPNKNLIIVDFGTATTICAISNEKTYLGGAILPGIRLSMESLSEKAAKLSNVEIDLPDSALGKTTMMQLQAGLVYGQLGAVKEIIQRIEKIAFKTDSPSLIATGGYAHLFEREVFFTAHMPDLILHGLRILWERNQS